MEEKPGRGEPLLTAGFRGSSSSVTSSRQNRTESCTPAGVKLREAVVGWVRAEVPLVFIRVRLPGLLFRTGHGKDPFLLQSKRSREIHT